MPRESCRFLMALGEKNTPCLWLLAGCQPTEACHSNLQPTDTPAFLLLLCSGSQILSCSFPEHFRSPFLASISSSAKWGCMLSFKNCSFHISWRKQAVSIFFFQEWYYAVQMLGVMVNNTTENLTVAAIHSSSGNDRSVAGTLEESNDRSSYRS